MRTRAFHKMSLRTTCVLWAGNTEAGHIREPRAISERLWHEGTEWLLGDHLASRIHLIFWEWEERQYWEKLGD
jgi:hypothetical protein